MSTLYRVGVFSFQKNTISSPIPYKKYKYICYLDNAFFSIYVNVYFYNQIKYFINQ